MADIKVNFTDCVCIEGDGRSITLTGKEWVSFYDSAFDNASVSHELTLELSPDGHTKVLSELSKLIRISADDPTSIQGARWYVRFESGLLEDLSGLSVGDWGLKESKEVVHHIQTDINNALTAIDNVLPGLNEDLIYISLTQNQASAVAQSDEYKRYISGMRDMEEAIKDERNPNRGYDLMPFLYGIRLRIENREVVSVAEGE